MTETAPYSVIENITFNLQQTINTEVKSVRRCVLLPDGRMVFSSYNEDRIRSFNKDGSKEIDFSLGTYTFDFAYIEETNTIAVTSGKCIKIIDMRNGEVAKTIHMNSFCFGIVYSKNTLIYNTRDNGLRMINLSDNSERDVIASKMSVYTYIATFNDKIYYTDKDTHTVTCCDFQGKTLWQFKDETILKMPYGITVNNDGKVYVVGNESTNVVVISTDGQHRRQLLSKDDGMDHPRVLHYESSTSRLLVANSHDVAFLYQITTNSPKM